MEVTGHTVHLIGDPHMTALLHLDASARRTSISRSLGAEFAATWRAEHPGGHYVHRDLAADPIPFIGEGWTELCDRVLAHGSTDLDCLADLVNSPAQQAAWEIVEPLLAEVRAADVVLIGTPMYNYSIPASLKAWLDQITFPRMSLAPTRFVVVTARGGAYSPGAPKAIYDYQQRYLRDFFAGHFAVQDTAFVNAELVNARHDPALAHLRDQHDASFAAALDAVRALGKEC
ncbi:FMN-dependent NADH-azoreductase [Nocardia tengchongensis]|uniref:FMN-dependent NADH-azoreductase n=1 Tax=Nocardia tengchongensis TaxID=2055889 RepID=UPI0036C13FB9